ncbi:MAG: hypothetical protein WBF33_20295 [Candidatus Nitrosopolaris sp.]|jgi:hypothetical protein
MNQYIILLRGESSEFVITNLANMGVAQADLEMDGLIAHPSTIAITIRRCLQSLFFSSAYTDSPGRGVAGAKNDLKRSLDKLDDFSFVIEAMIASESLPDLVGTYWKGSLTAKASPRDARTLIK